MADSFSHAAIININDTIDMIISKVNKDAKVRLSAWAKHAKKSTFGQGKTSLGRINYDVAALAKERMLEVYDLNHGNRPSYRYANSFPGDRRFSNGRLRKALASKDGIRATKDNIFFINKTKLDTRAPQWYRLNFGSGSEGGGIATAQSKTATGVLMKGMNFTQFKGGRMNEMPTTLLGASAPFATSVSANLSRKNRREMSTKGPGKFLYLQPRRKKIEWATTAQIRGSHFIEAAASVINKEYPLRISKAADDWFENLSRTNPKKVERITNKT